jgi:hypothetical protein
MMHGTWLGPKVRSQCWVPRSGPSVGSQGWVQWLGPKIGFNFESQGLIGLGPKVGSQGWVPRLVPWVFRLGLKAEFQGWVTTFGPNTWDTSLNPQLVFQGWVPRLQLPSPNEGLVIYDFFISSNLNTLRPLPPTIWPCDQSLYYHIAQRE